MIDHFYTSVAVAVSFAFKTCIARLLLYKYDDLDEASCIRHCVLYLLKTPITWKALWHPIRGLPAVTE